MPCAHWFEGCRNFAIDRPIASRSVDAESLNQCRSVRETLLSISQVTVNVVDVAVMGENRWVPELDEEHLKLVQSVVSGISGNVFFLKDGR